MAATFLGLASSSRLRPSWVPSASTGVYCRRDRQIKGRTQMPMLAVQLTIGDYAKWRPVFDKHRPLRDKAGFTNVHIYRNADNAREVIIWGETSDIAKVREALAGQELRNAMQEAGVAGPPKVHVIA
jgi:erythromycin esterase-like protein